MGNYFSKAPPDTDLFSSQPKKPEVFESFIPQSTNRRHPFVSIVLSSGHLSTQTATLNDTSSPTSHPNPKRQTPTITIPTSPPLVGDRGPHPEQEAKKGETGNQASSPAKHPASPRPQTAHQSRTPRSSSATRTCRCWSRTGCARAARGPSRSP